MAGFSSTDSSSPGKPFPDLMLNIIFPILIIFCLATGIHPTSVSGHVIPEDELRNQVYLSKREALTRVFEGIHKIKKEARPISQAKTERIEQVSGQKVKERKRVFYTGAADDGKVFATFGKAFANSHPVTQAKFILLMDSKGVIKNILIMEYKGPQRAEIISRDFLAQYVGMSASSDYSIVTSNQGPTASTQALTQAVHRLAATFEALYIEP